MTRREFDRRTKENWGGPRRMASDERENYRARRMRPIVVTRGFIERRAERMRSLRAVRYPWEPLLPTLGIGSPFRASARYRARMGLPMLAN